MLPPIRKSENNEAGIIKYDSTKLFSDLINDILDKNTYDEIKSSLNKHTESIQTLNDFVNNQIGDTDKESIEKLVKFDFKGYKKIKEHISIHTSQDIAQKFIVLIDNLFDYENVVAGIYIHKSEEFEKQINNIDIIDLQKFLSISYITFISSCILLSETSINYKKLHLFLDIGIESSEILQTYADTLDILTSE
jgi:hypothetical protein